MIESKSRILLVFVRHAESTKNLEVRFSSGSGNEAVTPQGDVQSAVVAARLDAAFKRVGISANECSILCPDSVRTMATASRISAAVGCGVDVDDALRPISAGNVAGMIEADARESAKRFIRGLELYRAGLGNSYDLAGYGEDVRAFESRVRESLQRLIESPRRAVIVVAHRSSITASLIVLARRSLGYPKEFYGYVQLDVGCVSAVIVEAERCQWIGVNVDAGELELRLPDAWRTLE